MTNEVKILIADDHPIFRNGLVQLLKSVPNFAVVAEAGDGDAALACLQQTTFDVAVLDIDMPEKDGLEVARAITAKGMNVRVIILTMHKNESLFNAALNSGVKGYVLKDIAFKKKKWTGCTRYSTERRVGFGGCSPIHPVHPVHPVELFILKSIVSVWADIQYLTSNLFR